MAGPEGADWAALGHGLLPGQSAVVESVHVDDFFGLDHNRGLGLVVFEAPLALEGHTELFHHRTAERPLL